MSDDAPIRRSTDDPRPGTRSLRPFARPGGTGRPIADAGTPVLGTVASPFVRPLTVPERVSDGRAVLAPGADAALPQRVEQGGASSDADSGSAAPLLGDAEIIGARAAGASADVDRVAPGVSAAEGAEHAVAELLVGVAERVRRRELRLPASVAPSSEAGALAAVLAALLVDAERRPAEEPTADRDTRARTER